MNEQQVAEAIAAWVAVTLPELEEVYPHITAGKGALPDAIVDVGEKRLSEGDPDLFPFESLEQTWLRIFECEVSILTAIEPGAGTEEEQSDATAQAEQEQLRDFGDRLEAAIFALHLSLPAAGGGDSIMVSPAMSFDYSAPFVQYEDGTRGRQMVWSLSLGAKVPALN